MHISCGDVRGVRREGSVAFLGIPFAQPPVGALQFAAPQPRRPWAGVFDATRYGPTAQVEQKAGETIPEPSTPGDDILNLNVFTPDPDSAGLPVMVWIHGGSYNAGCQNSSWYDGATFNADGIVTVSLGYRLGAGAWLHLPDAPDNRGALDWVAGLQWVRDNIAAFGGDPGRVTVVGQSAGGGAVLHLLTMPDAEGLFVRAMSISGAVDDESPEHAEIIARRLSEVAGVAPTAAAFARFDRQQLHALAQKIVDAGPLAHLTLLPFADGTVIPQPVVPAFRAGAAPVPLLIGTTSGEYNDIAAVIPAMGVEAATAVLISNGVSPEAAARIAAEYEGREPEAIAQAVTDIAFRQLAYDVALGHAATAPTWAYEFDWPSRSAGRPGLVFHCLDVPFWWNRLDGERVVDMTGPNAPQALATAMHNSMVSFIKGDDPGWAPSTPTYPNAVRWQDPLTSKPGLADVIDRH